MASKYRWMIVTLCLGCPGELAGTSTSTSSGDAGDSGVTGPGHDDSAAPTGATDDDDASSTSTTGDPDTTTSPATDTLATATLDTTGALGGTLDTTDTSAAADESTSGTSGPVCGDGVLDPEEQCDDGNDDPDDHCSADCTLGPADAGELLPLTLEPDEFLTCMTLTGDDLATGAIHWVAEQQQEIYAHVQQVPLPAAAPPAWSYHEKGGMYGRWPREAATASNGDVIVVGAIFSDFKVPDSGGYLWLARFTAAGALVWNHELPEHGFAPTDVELAADDSIVVVAAPLACCGGTPSLSVFDPQGQLVWQFKETHADDTHTLYGGVTLRDDGTIFVGGGGYHHDPEWNVLDSHVLVRAFAADGTPLWHTEQAAPDLALVHATDIVRTGDDVLVVTTPRAEGEFYPGLPALALAGFDTGGALLWWREWAPPDPWRAQPDQLVASGDGGVFLVGQADPAVGPTATLVARFAADGEPVWSKLVPGGRGSDAVLDPDGRLLVLTAEDIRAYAP